MHKWVLVASTTTTVATGCATGARGVAPQAPGKNAPLTSVSTTRLKPPLRGVIPALGVVSATTVNVTAHVDGKLASIVDGRPVKAGQLIATIESRPSRAPLNHTTGQLSGDRKARAGSATAVDTAAVAKTRALNVYTPIKAPTSGLAGLRKVDPGNFVHAGETLLTVTRLRPIAVVFSVPERYLSRVRVLLNKRATPVVEAFNTRDTMLLATGHLKAINNKIDERTGTIRLRTFFENADGALFPNEFVNVRLLVGARESNRR